MRILISLLLTLLPYVGLQAHHNTQAEFGAFGSETTYIEANIVSISWGNPHVMINVEATGGEFPVGERLRLVSHPITIADDHGFVAADFAVGDHLRIYGWTHIRNNPLIWMRAIQVNDGPMRSIMRFTDMIDIANGVFEKMNMEPAANLAGSPPGRAGPESVAKLREMGFIDEDGLMIWPPR
jgi:hypothetical protein